MISTSEKSLSPSGGLVVFCSDTNPKRQRGIAWVS